MARRIAVVVLSAIVSVSPAFSQEQGQKLPANTIDCGQFKKSGAHEWTETGTAVFDLGGIRDIHLTNQPVTPGAYKFGGVDVYPVLDQKCGAAPASDGLFVGNASNSKAEAAVTLVQSAVVPKVEGDKDKVPLSSPEVPAQLNASAQKPKDEIAAGEPEHMPCGDKSSVYIADALTETAAGKALVEIVFKNKMDGEEKNKPNSEFMIRGYINNELEWTYKGRIRQGRFVFTPIPSKQRSNIRELIHTATPPVRQDNIVLVPAFIKPDRKGAGEAILYLSGIHPIFAKENSHRFKFEGKRPSEYLPEAFYPDRCE